MTTRIDRQSSLVRRHQILRATRNLITTKGMEAVTIDAIAYNVGVTEGAIYRHFSSKRQILTLLIDEIEEGLLASVNSGRVYGESSLSNLERVLEAHLSDVEDNQAISFIIITEAIAFDGIGLSPRVSLMLTNYLEVIKSILYDGKLDGSIRSDLDIVAASTTFLGLIQSVSTLWALENRGSSLAEQRSQMWDIYRKGIAAFT